MAFILVKAATGPVLCGPAAATLHGGTVAVESATKLTVQGKAVLLTPTGSLTVSGCKTPVTSDTTGPLSKPCANASVTTTAATKLVVGGRKPLMMPVAGSADGMVAKVTPQLTVTATPNQSKLTTL
ncbi:MAG TPA: hypothetical protein VFI52_04400 [Gemmatimonadaceae bacterium]|nr:hypothetical protein [Gemmatimonadaceae bacterium]